MKGSQIQSSKSAQSRSDWLRKEGFGVEQKGSEDVQAVEIPVKKFKPRMESSLDRASPKAEIWSKPQPTKLQSALDRQTQVLRSKSPAPKDHRHLRRD